jgi:prophage tail gpP-like protein
MAIPSQIGAGESSTVSMLVQGANILAPAIEVKIWKSYSLTNNFLTPCDPWHCEIGDELLTPEIRKALVPGNRVKWFIDGAPQMSGYITANDSSTDRNGGTHIAVSGYDSMWPVFDSQINPNKHYPDKTSLESLLLDLLPQFGFANFFIDNGANVELAANRALHSIKGGGGRRHRRHTTRTKTLKRYKLPKKKAQHNDTFWQFLMRLLNRTGLWLWPTVDGTGVIVSTPEYDQDPAFELRRKFDGRTNNILRGGIRRDCSDQPSYICARGNVPPTVHEHHRTRVVCDNPYLAGLQLGLTLEEQDKVLGRNTSGQPNFIGPPKPTPDKLFVPNTDVQESQTFVSFMQRSHTEFVDKWTQVIPVKPVHIDNFFAPQTARPIFIKDEESHTLEELQNYAKQQMSLHARKALVAKYTIQGHVINGIIPQPDMVFSVDDEVDGFKGQLWVVGRTLTCSREAGVTCEIEGIPLQSIQL